MTSGSKIIIQRRQDLGLSQSYISDILGYSVQTISKWETGKSFPSLPSWGLLAQVLQIDLDALINDKIKSNYNPICLNHTFSSERFANHLRKQRRMRDMTQKELAVQLSISYQTLLAWEKGNAFPNVEQFKRLSEVMNLSYDELYFGEDVSASDSVQNPPEIKPNIKNRTRKNRVFPGLTLTFVFGIIIAALAVWLNRNPDSNPISQSNSTPNEPISTDNDSSNENNDSSSINNNYPDEIIMEPCGEDGVLERRFYYTDMPKQEKEKTIINIEYNGNSLQVLSQGCDYKFQLDASITASFSGKVTKIENDYEFFGKCVWIQHASGVTAFYASLGDIVVNINDEVESGMVIGTSGTSCYTENIGTETLHFGLLAEPQRYVDPEKYYGKSINDLKNEI